MLGDPSCCDRPKSDYLGFLGLKDPETPNYSIHFVFLALERPEWEVQTKKNKKKSMDHSSWRFNDPMFWSFEAHLRRFLGFAP